MHRINSTAINRFGLCTNTFLPLCRVNILLKWLLGILILNVKHGVTIHKVMFRFIHHDATQGIWARLCLLYCIFIQTMALSFLWFLCWRYEKYRCSANIVGFRRLWNHRTHSLVLILWAWSMIWQTGSAFHYKSRFLLVKSFWSVQLLLYDDAKLFIKLLKKF